MNYTHKYYVEKVLKEWEGFHSHKKDDWETLFNHLCSGRREVSYGIGLEGHNVIPTVDQISGGFVINGKDEYETIINGHHLMYKWDVINDTDKSKTDYFDRRLWKNNKSMLEFIGFMMVIKKKRLVKGVYTVIGLKNSISRGYKEVFCYHSMKRYKEDKKFFGIDDDGGGLDKFMV